MAVREVLRYPHPALKAVAEPVGPEHDPERIARDLLDTMRAFGRCVGVAAPQIAEPVRMCIVDCSEHPKVTRHNGLLVLVNPAVTTASGSEIGREGCLSIPELTANVRRATDIGVTAFTPAGDPLEIVSEGFEARCLQHEIDHLDGLLFLDRVASLTDDVFRRKRSG